jgi:hypothetical protein
MARKGAAFAGHEPGKGMERMILLHLHFLRVTS